MPGRREVLLGLMLTLGGPAALAQGKAAHGGSLLDAVPPDGRLTFYTRDELTLVSTLADTIIPRTDSPGALDAGVPGHLDRMMSAWASERTRVDHRKAVGAVRRRLAELGGSDITALPPAQRQRAIVALDVEAYASTQPAMPLARSAAPAPATPGESYRLLKRMIAQIYYISEPGATLELHYEPIPGRWLADAPLEEIGRTWAE